MARYLLTAGDYYYPESGDNDWHSTHETREEAEEQGVILTSQFNLDPEAGTREWYNIIDLQSVIYSPPGKYTGNT